MMYCEISELKRTRIQIGEVDAHLIQEIKLEKRVHRR